MIHGMSKVQFDKMIAVKYQNKIDNAKTRGIEFDLSFAEFRQVFLRKRCAYSGVELTIPRGQPTKTDITVERIDNKKGYIPGNVIAVCHEVNGIKSAFESSGVMFNVSDAVRIFANIGRLQKEVKNRLDS